MPGTPTRRFIGYPAGSLLAVLPEEESGAAVAAALRAAGIPDRDITMLRGPEGADRLDGTGAMNGVIARLHRLVSFTLMDQLVDMALYEQAVREGHVVLMARPRDDERKATAIGVLRQRGGHFINYYGRFATEEIERWQGPEPKVPASCVADRPAPLISGRVDRLEHEQGDDSLGFALIRRVQRKRLDDELPQTVTLGRLDLAGTDVEHLAALLDRRARIRPQIADPFRVLRIPAP
jgi:hypothetical protein